MTTPPRCECSRKELRRRKNRNGVVVVVAQCLDCGRNLGCVKKNGKAWWSMPEFDEELARAGWERRRLAWSDWEYRRPTGNDDFWARHAAHMASPKWQHLRRLVMVRCGGICEVCGAAVAVHAHHSTYERLGDEMLSDLVAVCLDCHEKIHGRQLAPRIIFTHRAQQ